MIPRWNYYNELSPYCCAWLRNLIGAGLLPPGEVDERPIQEVQPEDLSEFAQCHFFAGIGGWPLALRLAGWPDARPIWTGSCPCQPFSVAGRRKGTSDTRHLWPDFFRLIRAGNPGVVMGEQVAGAAGYAWLRGVGSDLEEEGYTWRAVDIPACSVGAPQIRNRLYWVAYPKIQPQREPEHEVRPYSRPDSWPDLGRAMPGHGGLANCRQPGLPPSQPSPLPGAGRGEEGGTAGQHGGTSSGLVQPPEHGWGEGGPRDEVHSGRHAPTGPSGTDGGVDNPNQGRHGIKKEKILPGRSSVEPDSRVDLTPSPRLIPRGCSEVEEVWGEARGFQPERRGGDGSGGLVRPHNPQRGPVQPQGDNFGREETGRFQGHGNPERPSRGPWDGYLLIGPDPSGKYRRVGCAGVYLRGLDHGVPILLDGLSPEGPLPLLLKGEVNRVGKLTALGNAIVPPLAVEVIAAWMDTHPYPPGP